MVSSDDVVSSTDTLFDVHKGKRETHESKCGLHQLIIVATASYWDCNENTIKSSIDSTTCSETERLSKPSSLSPKKPNVQNCQDRYGPDKCAAHHTVKRKYENAGIATCNNPVVDSEHSSRNRKDFKKTKILPGKSQDSVQLTRTVRVKHPSSSSGKPEVRSILRYRF